jgi:hypothetical protein
MADEVKIIGIDTGVRREIDWAKEATLSKLVGAANDQVSLLEKLANVKAVELRNVKEADAGLGKVSDASRETAAALTEGARARKKTDRELNESIRDLRWSMTRHSNNISNLLTRSTNPMNQLPSALEGVFGALAKITGRLPKIGSTTAVAFVAIGATVAKLAERFTESSETYRNMMQNGVMFNGSVSTMIQNVRSAGVGIEAASQVIDQYSQAILSVGESKFFKNIEDSTKIFARLGMTQEQGMRTFAELEEMRRLSGLSYMQSEDDRIKSNEQLVQLMQSQSILTGISVKRQKEAAQKAAQTERVRIMQASLSAEELKKQQEGTFKLAGLGLRPEAIEAALIEAMGGGVTQAGAAARLAVGPEFDRMVDALRSGRIEDIGTQEQIERLQQASTQRLQESRMLGFGGQAAQLAGGMALDVRAATLPATTARPGQETELEKRKRLAERAAKGEQIVDNTTQAYFQTVNNTAVALGRVEALAFRLADPVISTLMTSLAGLSDFVNKIIGGAGGMSNTALYGGLGVLAAGSIGAQLVGGALTRRAISSLQMPGLPQMAGPPPPPALAGATGGAAAMGGLRMLGGASILGGLVTGGSEYAQSRNLLKSLFVGGGSLIGTLGGGALGTAALPGAGTLAGGIAGGFVGERAGRALYDAMFGPAAAPGTPAADAAAAAPSVDFGGRFDQLAQRLGRQGPIVMELQNISNLMERMIDGINKVRGAVESR